jgi:tRNA nucleotidyltransferase (CCA-adding enzyme)
MHDLGKGATPSESWPAHHGHEGLGVKLVEQVCKRLKVPTECRDLAVMTAREHGNVGRALQLRPNTIVKLLERCDAFRKPARFVQMLHATQCDSRGRIGEKASFRDTPFPQLAHLEAALSAARGVNAGEIAQASSANPQRIPELVHRARVTAVRIALNAAGDDDGDDDQESA